MRKKKHKFGGFVVIALLAGGIALAKISGCTVNDMVHTIENMLPDEDPKTPDKDVVGEPLDPIIGEPYEERVFEVGEHKFYIFDDYVTEETMDAYNAAIEVSAQWPKYYQLHTYVTIDDAGQRHKKWLENTVPVRVTADENGEFTTYGVPVSEKELEETLVK
ncbi:MAG: hypothetical protein K6G60_08715 [Lachnospiraceae bacterium]|nr:hypothetical protein [Lachnospiraceae bacterium]